MGPEGGAKPEAPANRIVGASRAGLRGEWRGFLPTMKDSQKFRAWQRTVGGVRGGLPRPNVPMEKHSSAPTAAPATSSRVDISNLATRGS